MCMYICICTSLHVYTYIYIICIHVCNRIYIYIFMCIHICMISEAFSGMYFLSRQSWGFGSKVLAALALDSKQGRSHLQVGSLEVGSFNTPPIGLLQALYSSWEWYGSLMEDYLPTNYPPAKGFEQGDRAAERTTSLQHEAKVLPESLHCFLRKPADEISSDKI